MKRRSLCLLLVLVVMAGCVGTAYAATPDPQPAAAASPRAFDSFHIDIPAGEIVAANSSFSLAAGETVTISASYTPADASLDFGLISEEGVFYSAPASDGSFKMTIEVPRRGKYTLAVRNNADFDVTVIGSVNY